MLEFRHFVMYSFCGTGLCLTAVFMLLNFIVPVTEKYTRVQEIREIEVSGGKYHVELKEEPVSIFGIPDFTVSEKGYAEGVTHVKLTLQRGMFGMEVVKDAEFLK